MNAVIKSGVAGAGRQVRELLFEPTITPPSPDELRIAELEQRLKTVLAELADLRDQRAQMDLAIAEARSEGYERGLGEGRQIATDRLAELEETLSKAAAAAATSFAATLAHLEATSGELAGIALQRIVGDAGSRQDLVVETVRRALLTLSAEAVVEIEVSNADFPDLKRLEHIAPDGCAIRALAGLASGACRIRLRMGEIDLDLDGQVSRLWGVLDPARAESR